MWDYVRPEIQYTSHIELVDDVERRERQGLLQKCRDGGRRQTVRTLQYEVQLEQDELGDVESQAITFGEKVERRLVLVWIAISKVRQKEIGIYDDGVQDLLLL